MPTLSFNRCNQTMSQDTTTLNKPDHRQLSLAEEVAGAPGYSTQLSLSEPELTLIRQLIKDQYLQQIEQQHPDKLELFRHHSMADYHQLCHHIDHEKLWPKVKRILPQSSLETIQTLPFMKELEKAYGAFTLSDEEEVGYGEMYWRIVRPNCPTDVGPVHADYMFWDLGHGKMPANSFRVKVWLALFTEKGKSGFQFVPGSHLEDIPYVGEKRGLITKPRLLVEAKNLALVPFAASAGDTIVFNDCLLHGGLVGGEKTRSVWNLP